MKKILAIIVVCLLLLVFCSAKQNPVKIAPITQTQSGGNTEVSPVMTEVVSVTPEPVFENIISNWQWPRSTPEEQGLSSQVLAEMIEQIKTQDQPIHSILIIRHGVLVMEAYKFPFNPQTRHKAYSVTKSVTSAMTGIAIEDGSLKGVKTPLINYFPSIVLDDPAKEKITIENLLTMTSGIEWMEQMYSGLNDLWWISEAEDPAQYFFTPALINEPGKVFNYNSGGSQMLSLLIQQTTAKKVSVLAEERLFNPLGITDFFWEDDMSGHSIGGTGLELLPVDMAKIGWLYLKGGSWQGKQIVSSDWVSSSTQVHSHPSDGMGYGYQWWIRPQGDYYALGWGGQQIRVFPEQDMVVVITAGSSGNDMLHNDLIDHFILPAVISDEPIRADRQNQERLQSAVESLSSPGISFSSVLSPMAAEVDGKQWLITGMGTWNMFTLHFTNDKEAQFDLTIDGDPMPLNVGLDGIYRITDTTEYGPIALSGYWDSENTFVLIQQVLREADHRKTRIVFSDQSALLTSEWFVEPHFEETEAVLFDR